MVASALYIYIAAKLNWHVQSYFSTNLRKNRHREKKYIFRNLCLVNIQQIQDKWEINKSLHEPY